MIANTRKVKVIQKIERLSDEIMLKKIEQLLDNTSNDLLFIQKYVKPIRKTTDIDALVKAKAYKGMNNDVLKSISQTIDIPQETEDLLAMLD